MWLRTLTCIARFLILLAFGRTAFHRAWKGARISDDDGRLFAVRGVIRIERRTELPALVFVRGSSFATTPSWSREVMLACVHFAMAGAHGVRAVSQLRSLRTEEPLFILELTTPTVIDAWGGFHAQLLSAFCQQVTLDQYQPLGTLETWLEAKVQRRAGVARAATFSVASTATAA